MFYIQRFKVDPFLLFFKKQVFLQFIILDHQVATASFCSFAVFTRRCFLRASYIGTGKRKSHELVQVSNPPLNCTHKSMRLCAI